MPLSRNLFQKEKGEETGQQCDQDEGKKRVTKSENDKISKQIQHDNKREQKAIMRKVPRKDVDNNHKNTKK